MNRKLILACALFVVTFLCSIFSCHSIAQQKTGQTAHSPVSIKTMLDIGGEKQYVEITGASDKEPVILFIHGGPGWPQIPQLRYFNSAITQSFILATWDQRGCGLSYLNNPSPLNMTLHQIVEDAHQLTQYLLKKFHKKKIILAGYSWGSIVGVELALRYPQDYSAYIGIAQVINVKEGMAISQKWLTGRATEKGDINTLKTIAQLQMHDTVLCITNLDCFMKQYELVNSYHGAVFNPDTEKESEKAISAALDYSAYDWMKGFNYSARLLEKDMFATDFRNVRKLEVPVYLFLGRHDWNVPSVLAEAFLNNLDAPHKEIIWFENSGHGIPEEEPQKFNSVISEYFSSY
ncbi:alpha/beta fold hydrolase [Flavihumibacter fluvii]|uniref:alpha/beta fold hydrolase n=1 Tax=Flavihumibacter fluvii TaxID=2838157 RepID=UPI001BDEF77B|nr:alpha/beta hydrolase [Flavihumibacter fluvii]ULQ53986.1 alpha/beta hydrolase [Flavihumibacter fluvii]